MKPAVKYLGVFAGVAVTGMLAYSWIAKPPVGLPVYRAVIHNFNFEVR